MTTEFDVKNLTQDQLRQLLLHFGQLANFHTEANNGIIVALGSVMSLAPAEIADRLQSTLNEWSAFMNHATMASDAEVRRILGIDSSPSTLQ